MCNYHDQSSNFHPLIVIIGATGCGKTKLSIELAKHFNGEIISADSMQIYKGLDIATNKATREERQQAPHHLIDQIDPFQQFTVLDFQKHALKAIDSIIAKQKFPIIVGGTNYYIESILWDTLVGAKVIADSEPIEDEFRILSFEENNQNEIETSLVDIKTVEDLLKQKITYRDLRLISDEKLHEFLKKIDPESANMLHVNNRRKVIRSLQVFQQTGQKMSSILEVQRSKGSRHGGPLRFPNSIIFWVDCEKKVLDKRLDDRVDEMIRLGLIEELLQFHRDYNEKHLKYNLKAADYTEGIFQAIGLKEFHRYLLMNEEERKTYDGDLKLGNGILMLKQRTRSYVNKQLKWIRRRFLVNQTIRNVPNVYRLDTTKPENWNDQVRDKSIQIVENCLRTINSSDPEEKEQIWKDILDPLSANGKITSVELTEEEDTFISGQFYCDICQVTISGGKSYREHLNSKRHIHQIKLQQSEKNSKQESI